MFIYKTTQANHGSEFEWLGLEPNDHGPSEIGTCSVFEPPLYAYLLIWITCINFVLLMSVHYSRFTKKGKIPPYLQKPPCFSLFFWDLFFSLDFLHFITIVIYYLLSLLNETD